MTREEVIKIFNTVLLFGKCDCPKEECEECFKMAIKALSQEPCEDCVSRKATAKFLRNHAKDFDDTKVRMAFRAASSLVENADNTPSVTPTRKKGKWIKLYFGSMYDICSECGQKVTTGYFEYNYCPSCGAEMEGEVDDEQ